jgi:hypothetical protein
MFTGAPGRIRTCDARLRSPALYPLSYEGGDCNATQNMGWIARAGSVVVCLALPIPGSTGLCWIWPARPMLES